MPHSGYFDDTDAATSVETDLDDELYNIMDNTDSGSAVEEENLEDIFQDIWTGDSAVKEIQGPNHVITIDPLDKSQRSTNILDSHTSYKRALEREIIELKVKLAEAHEQSDTLQNEFARLASNNGDYYSMYQNSKKRCDELEALVSHLEDNAKEASDGRKTMQEKADKYNIESQSFMRNNEQLRTENRKLKRDLKEAEENLKWRGMENQALKNENERLKNKLGQKTEGGARKGFTMSDLMERKDGLEVVSGIQNLLSFKTKPNEIQSNEEKPKSNWFAKT